MLTEAQRQRSGHVKSGETSAKRANNSFVFVSLRAFWLSFWGVCDGPGDRSGRPNGAIQCRRKFMGSKPSRLFLGSGRFGREADKVQVGRKVRCRRQAATEVSIMD